MTTRPREEAGTFDNGMHMYLDLLTNTALLDPQVWASADTWTNSDTVASAVEFAAKKKKKSSSGLLIGGICCLVVVALIVGGIYLLTQRKKQQ
ncbi:hypothetical protein ACQP2U_00295 [Nocardia sp. CA-084685]|uniref:hypothetical protein n=1 Tax=Nocardia sp. CA-084685 TaxID=3239970 RepID=UPI003D964EF3